MGNLDIRWPRLPQYQAAVIKAEADFKDERLRGLKVQRHPTFSWDALPWAGNFGVVFRVAGNGVAYALKLFYRPQQDRELRYRLIYEHLRNTPMPHRLVSFAYDEAGIRVGDRDYPTLRMDWADGDPLDTYLGKQFSGSAGIDNGRFMAEWIATVRDLQGSGIAHGDLQHKNILVQPDGTFRLVDYDGMFVPGMREQGLVACEAGVSAYQHPMRKSGQSRFDERMDNFSALVILLTLACVDADLWKRYHEEGRLLLTEEDLLHPDESALLTELSARKGTVGTLASLVRIAARQDLDQVPSFASVINDLETDHSDEQDAGSRILPAVTRQVPTAAGRPDATTASPPPLTYQQRQVAGLLASGKNVDEIASALGLFRTTVEEHVRFLESRAGPAQPATQVAASPPAKVAASPPAKVAASPPAKVAASPPAEVAGTPSPRASTPERTLSPRQQEVLDLLKAGLVPTQIATRLALHPGTVRRYVSSIRGVVGAGEVDKLLNQAAAKQARAEPTTQKRDEPAAEAVRPQPVRPGGTTRTPATPPVRPVRTRSRATAVTWTLISLIILVILIVALAVH